MRNLVRLGWLMGIWLLLWAELSIANIVTGFLLAGAILLLFPVAPTPITGTIRPWETLRFLVYFLWKLAEASLIVAWEVITPRNQINEGIVAVPIRGASDLLTTLVANAISLTPGTLTIEVDAVRRVLYVHVLHLRDVETVRRSVHRLETLAIEAFGSERAIEAAKVLAGGGADA